LSDNLYYVYISLTETHKSAYRLKKNCDSQSVSKPFVYIVTAANLN